MAEKTKTKTTEKKFEREYVIPLREKSRPVPRYRKTPKAVKTIKEFLARHMKIYDRDLNKIKIDKFLNEYLWFRGIKKHPHKIKIKAIKQGDIVKVELVEIPDKLKFKKARQEKQETKAKEALEQKKSAMQKAKESMQKPKEEKSEKKKETEDKDQDGVDDKKEEKEKKSAVEEANQKQQKQLAKTQKRQSTPKSPEQQKREQTTRNKLR